MTLQQLNEMPIRLHKSFSMTQTAQQHRISMKEHFNSILTSDKKYSWTCKDCSTSFVSSLENGKVPTCPKCFPKKRSKMETEFILECLENKTFRQNQYFKKYKFELDFIIQDNLAIELNGNYWHSENIGKKDKSYHLNKTNICNSHDLDLFHIFEDEWIYKKSVIKSMVNAKLNIFTSKIFARNCSIKNISIETISDFLSVNSLFDYTRLEINLGLFQNDELYFVMSFNKLDSLDNFELVTFCSKLNTRILGGLSRLLDYFKKSFNPHSIICRIDRRINFKSYLTNFGFVLLEQTSPNFFLLGSDKLKRIVPFVNIDCGDFDKIWDVGKNVYIWYEVS